MKPNWNKSKSEWDDVLVEDQLRSGGLIEALRVLKLGYPTRVPYQRIWDKFNGKIKNPLVNNLDQMGFAQAVLMAFGVDQTTYELGLTRIWFKRARENLAKWGRVLGMVSRTVVRHADYA